MFKTIELTNYRVFDHVVFDLTGPKDSALDYAVVYGRNASGKTALINSVEFLKTASISFPILMKSLEVVNPSDIDRVYAENGGIRVVAKDISVFTRSNVMKQAESPMSMRYRFEVDGRDAEYTMEFSQDGGRLISECLRYVSPKGRMVEYYSVDERDGSPKISFNDRVFPASDLRYWVESQAEQWWGRQTLLSIVMYGALIRNRPYMGREMPCLMRVIDYLDHLNSSMSGFGGEAGGEIERSPMHGWIGSDDVRVLEAFEAALDRFMTRVDPDLESVGYETRDSGSGRVEYTLFFDRRIAGKVRRIWYTEESSGVRKLIGLFPRLLGCANGRVAFIDEMDTGIHDKLMRDLFRQVLPDMRGQLVASVQNTYLLEELDPKKVFIIDVDMDGARSIRPISDIVRTRTNNNNRDRYMRGDLGGVPYIACVDMENMAEHLREDINKSDF